MDYKSTNKKEGRENTFMVTLEELRNIIDESGIRRPFLARKLGISNQSLSYKLNGKREFKASEVSVLADALRLDDKEAMYIFLGRE